VAGSVCLPVPGDSLSLSGSLLGVTGSNSDGLIGVDTLDKLIPWLCAGSLVGLDASAMEVPGSCSGGLMAVIDLETPDMAGSWYIADISSDIHPSLWQPVKICINAIAIATIDSYIKGMTSYIAIIYDRSYCTANSTYHNED